MSLFRQDLVQSLIIRDQGSISFQRGASDFVASTQLSVRKVYGPP